MTPKQAERLRQKITDIRRVLAAEKRKFGCYDDSRGLRYSPLKYYVQLGDFKGGLTYLRWFHRNFPDDAGFPDFLFEWTLILFRNGRLQDATQKALATYRADTHILDRFLGRPVPHAEPWEDAPLDAASYAAYFDSLGGQAALADFGEWLGALTLTEAFLTDASRFIDLHRQLHGEADPERRRYLVRQLYPGSSGNNEE
jgi:hypothetical protein